MINNNLKMIGEGDPKGDLYNNISNANTGEEFRIVAYQLNDAMSSGILNVGEVSDCETKFMHNRSQYELSKGVKN